jgi:transposase
MPRGRQTKLTPAVQQAIITAIAGGVPYYQACLMADVKHSTATLWRERGENGHSQQGTHPLYIAFITQVKKAEAQDEARRLLRINQAGQGGTVISETTTTYPDGRIEHEVKRTSPQWQADAWHLERKYPDRYGRRVQANVNLDIQALATKVASELGLEVSVLMAEAQQLLREHS